VLGFEGACRAAGVDSDVVVRVLSATQLEVLEELRDVPASPDANEWRLHFAEMLLHHVGDAALD